MFALVEALEDEAVDLLPREAHAHPDPRLRLLVEIRGDRVVEGAVQVRGQDVDGDARDGADGGDADRRPRAAPPGGRAQQLELLSGARRRRARRRRRPRVLVPQGGRQPTADRSASTRSVRSQVNSGSSRPKWP